MLKSLFFKPKSESIDILPPPPPFPSMELEEGGTQLLAGPQEAKTEISEDDELNDLLTGLDKEFVSQTLAKEPKQTKAAKIKEEIIPRQKLSKKELNKLKKLQRKEAKQPKTKKTEEHEDLRDFGLLGNDFESSEPKSSLEGYNEFPGALGDLDIDYISSQEKMEPEIKDEALDEAQEEIKNAIESAGKQNKQPLFKKIFGKNERPTAITQAERENIDSVSKIRNKIGMARDSLMDINVEAAREYYIEIMEIYNQISPKEQAKVYNDIKELYFERKSAEQLRV